MADVPNRELVVYVLATLGGNDRRVHTEDIAVKSHELFPESFSWTKYTHLPDKDIVRVALIDARKPQWGALVDGRAGQGRGHAAKTNRDRVRDGWVLTENGIKWARAHSHQFEALVGKSDLKEHRQKVRQDLANVRKHRLFLMFRENPDSFVAPIGELADFVRCRVDAPDNVWMGRFDVLQRKAVAADESDMLLFVEKVRESYLRQK